MLVNPIDCSAPNNALEDSSVFLLSELVATVENDMKDTLKNIRIDITSLKKTNTIDRI